MRRFYLVLFTIGLLFIAACGERDSHNLCEGLPDGAQVDSPDGCNTCFCEGGKIGKCTEFECKKGTPPPTTGDDDDDNDDNDTGGTEIALDERLPDEIKQLEIDNVVSLDGPENNIYIVRDIYGIPHVYAATERDAAFASGYLMAENRYFQMELLRRVLSGSLSKLVGAEMLGQDSSLRLLMLRRVAEEACENYADDSREKIYLQGFANGVNAYIQNSPIVLTIAVELSGLGINQISDIEPWTCADSMTLARYQTWDLSNGYEDEPELATRFMKLSAVFGDGDPREGLVMDLLSPAPVKPAFIVADEVPATFQQMVSRTNYKTMKKKIEKGLRRFNSGLLVKAGQFVAKLKNYKDEIASEPSERGSNNWVVAPENTEGGYALMASDPHLSLTNPPIFYIIHLNTKWAEGKMNVAGVAFPGIPPVLLGRNERGAWGGTVHFSDVLDFYVEAVAQTEAGGRPAAVLLDGKEVAVTKRTETFQFPKGSDDCLADADKYLDSSIKAVHPYSAVEEEGVCVLTVEFLTVPHHGPIVAVAEDGKSAVSMKWTGFEPTEEFTAFLNNASTVSTADFRNSFNYFGVGTQNMVFANTDGDIQYYAHGKIPVRKTYSYEYPPYMPMPGTGEFEWAGFIADADIAQSENPEKGYLITANNDPWGNTADGNPLNETIEGGRPYLGSHYDCGYRANRIERRFKEKLDAGKKLTFSDMKAIQGDHTSNVGEDFAPLFISVLEEAKNGDNPKTKDLFEPRMDDALTYLKGWSFEAASGATPDASKAEIDNSIAAAVFNAWFGYFVPMTIGDELRLAGTSISTQQAIRAMARFALQEDYTLVERGSDGHPVVFDDIETEAEESRDEIIVKALASALDFLASEKGFGTEDMTAWRWGNLHTITLEHLAGVENFNTPSSGDPDYPKGFPRPCDNFCVDSSDHGLGKTELDADFSYSGSGPAMRLVCELVPDKVACEIALPGGQSGRPGDPHYSDLMRNYWWKNEYFRLNFYDDEITEDKENFTVLVKKERVEE
ncbi:MAG: penicillin acylase family protein [Myxococcota bacterium]